MRIATLATTLCLTVFGTIAPAQNVTYDYDRTANFSVYKTYAWTRGTELGEELMHQRVVRAIDQALRAKGIAPVTASDHPDVLVAYHASVDRDLQITGSTSGLGPFDLGDRWGSARVQPILVGTLVVDISNARTKAVVWRSMASSDIRPNDSPEKRDKKIAKAMEKMFKNYPPRSSR